MFYGIMIGLLLQFLYHQITSPSHTELVEKLSKTGKGIITHQTLDTTVKVVVKEYDAEDVMNQQTSYEKRTGFGGYGWSKGGMFTNPDIYKRD